MKPRTVIILVGIVIFAAVVVLALLREVERDEAELVRSISGIVEVSNEMVKTGLGWPMGVFELLDDTASFDSFYHAQEYLYETCGERYAIPDLARKVFQAGYCGAPALKPGSRGGWYDYLNVQRPPKEGK